MKIDPEIKLNNLNDICCGEKKFMIEIIDLYIAQSEPQVNDLYLAIAEKNNEKLKKIAHKFKSSAQLFEIAELVELLLTVEKTELSGLKEIEKKKILKEIKDISKIVCDKLKVIRKDYD